ncbi:MAG: OmpH family outer membrane protein [Tannerellaceae bacterium]|jgi:outer membrane protein|nr:OmpH family outer membrane protein [Tannerellaceae bacterium]
MKNINYIINGVLAVAVIILFILHFTGKKELVDTKKPTLDLEENLSSPLPVAYVNMDSLLQNYNYYKDLNEIIVRKEENARASVNQQGSQLQSEIQDFERKVNNNAFLTRERAEQEQQRLVKKRQELEALDNRLTQELMAEQQKLIEQLRDSLSAQLKIFNHGKNYQIIFSNISNDNILLADDAFDITNELLIYLNKSYSPTHN